MKFLLPAVLIGLGLVVIACVIPVNEEELARINALDEKYPHSLA